MANPILELTFSGLCVLVLSSSERSPTASSAQLGCVESQSHENHPRHFPKLAFRGIDYVEAPEGFPAQDFLPVGIGPDGEEIIQLKLPPKAAVEVYWEDGAVATEFNMTWNNQTIGVTSPGKEMNWAPNLRLLGIEKVNPDGPMVAAKVSRLPFGSFETRSVVRDVNDTYLQWYFKGADTDHQPIANQIVLRSEGAKPGSALIVKLNGKSHKFQSLDGPLRMSLTNLPEEGPILVESPKNDQPIAHLDWIKGISPGLVNSLVLPKRRAGALFTRQGRICPTLRFHEVD